MVEQTRFLDNQERYGFMRKGKPFSCNSCARHNTSNSPRLYDNDRKTGPICLDCAKIAVLTEKLTPVTPPVVELSPGIDELMQKLSELIEQLRLTEQAHYQLSTQVAIYNDRVAAIEAFLNSGWAGRYNDIRLKHGLSEYQ
jgi:hypothetical protein